MIEKQTFDFLKKLAKNNNRDWFKENKPKFELAKANVEEFVDKLIAKVIQFDKRFNADLKAKDCIFRIYRDVRFAKDKSPYKTNFGANISPGGKKSGVPGYYLHIKPGDCFVGGGMYKPDGKQLAAVRQEIDYNTADLRKILNSKTFKNHFDGLKGEQLKTAPKGYPKDHPAIDLLRFKGYFTLSSLNDGELQAKEALKVAVQKFKAIAPLNTFIQNALS